MERKQSYSSSELKKAKAKGRDDLEVENGEGTESNRTVINEKDPNEVAVDAFVVDENDKTKINYKNMGWIKAGALISAETIALGILSFPSVFHRLGMATGILLTVLLAATSWYTGYILIQFKVNHPGVMNFGDAGRVVAGRSGAIVMGGLLMLKVVLVAASHSLSGGIALSNISDYKICSLAYAAIITVVSFLLCVPRTFEKVSWISFVSVASILIACLITIVGSGTQDLATLQSATGKQLGPVVWYASEHHELIDVIGALTNIIFAYGGHVALFSFASEMRDPKDFTKSLALVQILATSWYILVGATIYSFSGQYVTSPALTGTADAVRITAYSIALISIIVAGVVASLVAGKYVWLQMFRGTKTLTSASLSAWAIWILIMGVIWILAFILQGLIPFFNQLLSIISSLATVWFTYGLSSVMWFNMNSKKNSEVLAWTSGPGGWFSSPSKIALSICNFVIFTCSAGIMGLGIYSAVQGIIDGYDAGTYTHPFSCARP